MSIIFWNQVKYFKFLYFTMKLQNKDIKQFFDQSESDFLSLESESESAPKICFLSSPSSSSESESFLTSVFSSGASSPESESDFASSSPRRLTSPSSASVLASPSSESLSPAAELWKYVMIKIGNRTLKGQIEIVTLSYWLKTTLFSLFIEKKMARWLKK